MKKFLMIMACFLFVFVGAFGIAGCDVTKMKAEVNGIIFETIQWEETNALEEVEEGEYEYMRIMVVQLSLTNTNDTEFSFQAESLSTHLKSAYWFTFKYAVNTATDDGIHGHEYVVLPAHTQTTFIFVLQYNSVNVGRIENEEQMTREIDENIETDREYLFGARGKCVLKYLNRKILAQGFASVRLLTADKLIKEAKGEWEREFFSNYS